MKPPMLIALYCLLGVLPFVLMIAAGLTQTGDLRAASLGAGAAALALLLLQFLSSGRYDAVSGHAGIDRTMRFHQLAARAVAALAVLHPLLLMTPRSVHEISTVPAQAAYLFGAAHLRSGTLALVLLLLLAAMGVLRNRLPIRYEVWRASHALGALLVAIAAMHHIFAVGVYTGSTQLAAYWWIMAALAFGTLGYVYLIKPFVLARHPYRVVSNHEVGHRIREIALEPMRGKALDFDAGQFGWVLLDQPPITLLDHPFSFSSAPAEGPGLRLLIKSRGDFTSSLHTLAPGARAYVDGPHGNFTLAGRSGTSIALIAGGIGIAPIVSLLHQLRGDHDGRPIGLLYGARSTRQLVHADEIRAAARELDLQWQFFVDEPAPGWDGGVGELTRESIRTAIRGEPDRCLCFVCGPTAMMLACRRHALASGVLPGQIVFERFDYD